VCTLCNGAHIQPLSFMSELFRGELMTMTVPLLRLSVPDRNFIWAGSHTNANNVLQQLLFQFQLRMCVRCFAATWKPPLYAQHVKMLRTGACLAGFKVHWTRSNNCEFSKFGSEFDFYGPPIWWLWIWSDSIIIAIPAHAIFNTLMS
jgi:hypothetical protein